MVLTLEAPQVSQPAPAPRPRGRATEFTQEIASEIITRVRSGYTVRKVAEILGYDDCTIYDWQHAFPEFADQVAQARRQSAIAWADKAADAAESAMENPGERGERARGCAVAVGNAQWQAERRDPANWGQRSALAIDARVTVSGEAGISMADLISAARVVGPVPVAGGAVMERPVSGVSSGAVPALAAGQAAGAVVELPAVAPAASVAVPVPVASAPVAPVAVPVKRARARKVKVAASVPAAAKAASPSPDLMG